MRIPYYEVDAFTARTFGGNPAGVCVLENWLADDLLQRIAAENNLSETAFFVPVRDGYHLRWFTPVLEVDLCGHATLASAFVLFSELRHPGESIRFNTRSDWVTTTRVGDVIELDFPSRPPGPCAAPSELLLGLGKKPRKVLRSRDYLAVFEHEADVVALAPDMSMLARLDSLGIIATAPGNESDFVSRFFAPRAGIPEDPVTGSAHCSLIPYWAEELGRSTLYARQVSKRGGELYCRNLGGRVGIGGRAVVYCRGELDISAVG